MVKRTQLFFTLKFAHLSFGVLIVGAIFEQGGKKLEATKFLLIWLLYDPNGQDPKGF